MGVKGDLPLDGARLMVVPNTGAIITLALDGGEAMRFLDLDDERANVVTVGLDYFEVAGPDSLVARCERVAVAACRDLASLSGRIIHVVAAGEGLTSFFGAQVHAC
jgi:hypothetical protein